MPDSPHPFDGVVQDILDWIEEETPYYVDALKMGHRAPFAASTSEEEKRGYYRRQVFQTDPNGTVHYDHPNQQGRDMLLKRLGIPGYTQVLHSVMPKQNMRDIMPESSEKNTSSIP